MADDTISLEGLDRLNEQIERMRAAGVGCPDSLSGDEEDEYEIDEDGSLKIDTCIEQDERQEDRIIKKGTG